MHSSISSSNQRLPKLAWKPILMGGLAIFLSFVGGLEFQLSARGFQTTVVDSEALWIKERARAKGLGKKALILVGASRIQLGLDLGILKRTIGLEPLQLSVDGSSFVPILDGLARDPSIKGTVLVDYIDHVLASPHEADVADTLQQRYECGAQKHTANSLLIEEYLAARLRRYLRSYADGARPITSLITRVWDSTATPQYLVTLPDRSRRADYRMVRMPEFYYARVVRNLGPVGQAVASARHTTYTELDQALESEIRLLQAADNSYFLHKIEYLESLVQAIKSRGGHVIFVVMPTSGLVKEINDRRFPRQQFWDVLVSRTSAGTLHFEDLPALRAFTCPDGSHLDFRDRERFTHALVQALDLNMVKSE